MTQRSLSCGVILVAIFATALFGGGCASSGGHTVEVALVRDWLSGSFTNAEQAAKDPSFRDVQLHVAPIWNNRADGPWLYVEQAPANDLGNPLQQRIYRLVRTGNHAFVGEMYRLPEPARQYANVYMQDEPLGNLTPEQLIALPGCALTFTHHHCSNIVEGGTKGNACANTTNGAAYTTTELILWDDFYIFWERGYDASGRQVWGPEKGGYRYKKISASPKATLADDAGAEMMK